MPRIDLAFRLHGDQIPADHGYLLYSALTRITPGLHDDHEIAIAPIAGQPIGDRSLRLHPKSHLVLRLEAERIAELLPLAGKTVAIGKQKLQIGVPEVHPLLPRATLYSRLVVIKGFMEPEPFLGAVQRQLDKLGIQGNPALVPQPSIAAGNAESLHGSRSPFLRRTLRIRNHEIVGFAVRITGLTADESVRLQEAGVGGRRRFGCGFLIPDRR